MMLLLILFLIPIAHGSHLENKEENSWNINRSENSSAPNVIILLADDLGFGDLSFSGHPTSRTPNIDQLAREGRFFTHFYVTSPVCSPSRSSVLTGRYQVRSGSYPGTYIPTSVLGLPHNETTMAKLLKLKNYRTQYVGKWHLGVGANKEFLPSNDAFGFDNFYGLPYSHDMCPCNICFPDNSSCLEGCWDSGYVSCPLFDDEEIIEQPVYLPTLSTRLLERALQFLSDVHDEQSPFFLFYAFHHIHHPQFSSSSFTNSSDRGVTGDSLMELDFAVKSIVDFLEEKDLLQETLIWFTSDNGPSLQRHERGGCAGLLRCGKGTTWEGGVRVPAIINWPGKIEGGMSNALTSSLDILPTVASLTGISASNLTLDGTDISSVLFDNNSKSPRRFFAVYPETPSEEDSPFAVVFGKYKAHFYTKGSDLSDKENYDPLCPGKHPLTKHEPPLLYDLFSDPGERYDLSHLEQYEDILAEITAWREQHKQNMTWMKPRTQVYSNWAQPCCTNPLCEPFPQCCDCVNPSSGNSRFFGIFDNRISYL